MSIIFITNTDLNHRKGGWDGLGGKIYDLLHDRLENFTGIDQINPPVFKLDLIKYRLQKEFNFLRIFPAYSIRRLNVISDLLASHQQQTFEHILFHGSTPWSSYTPEVPYSTILDCCFSTYIKTYHNISHFNSDYLKRIINLDRSFLQKAHAVFFTSHWAMNQTCQDYQMTGDNFVYIGQGPSIDFIENNFSALKDQFLFIATDFTGKGGLIVFDGFKRFLISNPGYKLVLVGQKPPKEVLAHSDIEYLGYIDKSTKAGRDALFGLYAESKANILLTQKDISPLVIIESGYAGCPTIANPLSAIPELIDDGITGWLIAPTAEQLAQTLNHHVTQSPEQLHQMRSAVKLKMKTQYNWDRIAVTLIDALQTPLAE